MSCPNIAVLEQDLTFTTQYLNGQGEPADLDALPTYKIYEELTDTEIASGTMAKQDDANTLGYYVKRIETTTGDGFETLKTYTIRIKGAAGGVPVAVVFSFICLGQSDLTVATGDLLTTVERFKLYKGITTSTDDTLIGQLIARATNAIQVFCNRDFVVKSYREFEDGCGQTELNLRQFPVVSVEMLGVGREDAFQIINNTAGAYNAQVSITESDMTLQVMGGANNGSETLTLANYDTLSDLFTAITALNKGWAILENASLNYWSPIELLPTGKGLSCLSNYASPQIPSEPEEEFVTDNKAGIVKLWGVFSTGFQNIVVRYSAGYAEIPADLEQICIDLTCSYYDKRNLDSSLKREKIGDYEYETGLGSTETAGSLPGKISQRLMKWMTWA